MNQKKKIKASLADFIQKLCLQIGLTDPKIHIDIVQTHISWIILTGKYAYKIKKNINFGFIDFSSLKKRQHYCYEEIRLNQRFAPNLYLDVVKITGTVNRPIINGSGKILEYAVKMIQFPATARLDLVLNQNLIDGIHFDLLAEELAKFHAFAERMDDKTHYGTPSQVIEPQIENLEFIKEFLHNKNKNDESILLGKINTWCTHQFQTLAPYFQNRKRDGFIRDCHGDLHLENIIYFEHKMIPFDCIEFNNNLRCIDIVSDIAFLIMDLEYRGHFEFANRFANHYFEFCGDYQGIHLLNFYKTYRALVRAKICCIRLQNEVLNEHEIKDLNQHLLQYLQLAHSYTARNKNMLMLMHGLSGSGKSNISLQIIEKSGGIRLRSDCVRKNIFAGNMHQIDDVNVGEGIYTKNATDVVYKHLLDTAKQILDSGYNVIVDATFLIKNQRSTFFSLADSLGIQIRIIRCSAPEDLLKKRILQRQNEKIDMSDANLNVLHRQLEILEPLDENEIKSTIDVDTQKIKLSPLIQQIRAVLA